MKKFTFSMALSVAMAATSNLTHAIPLVTYTVSGSEGSYTIDFTVENTIDASYGQSIYFFGVDLLDQNKTLSANPTGWVDYPVWNNKNFGYGGSDINYLTNWYTPWDGSNTIESGESLSGFTVFLDALPEQINFFAYSTGAVEYDVGDEFYQDWESSFGWNLGFEGVAEVASTTTPVPEPSSIALIGLGLAGIGFARRKK